MFLRLICDDEEWVENETVGNDDIRKYGKILEDTRNKFYVLFLVGRYC